MTDYPSYQERGFNIGGGPFQPPANVELEALRAQLTEEVDRTENAKAEAERLRRRLAEYVSRENVETPDDLSKLLGYVFSEYDPTVFVDADDEELSIRIPGLTIRDGEIAAVKREFEVSAEISFEFTAQITAGDEDEAQEIFRDALDEELSRLHLTIDTYEGVESDYTTDAEIGRVDVTDVSF